MSEKVFCKDCKHRFVQKRQRMHPEGWVTTWHEVTDRCALDPSHYFHPVNGRVEIQRECQVRNHKMDCGLYEPKPPPRPWWKFWGAR